MESSDEGSSVCSGISGGMESYGELSSFLDSGIYRLRENSGVVFVDPVRLLDDSYSTFRLNSSVYYSRYFNLSVPYRSLVPSSTASLEKKIKKKKKRKNRPRELNERELSAERRHHEARPFLLKAHDELLRVSEVVALLRGLVVAGEPPVVAGVEETNFVELGKLWQAPLYQIRLCLHEDGQQSDLCVKEEEISIFNNFVHNATSDDVVAKFLGNSYILPKNCSFLMSDLRQIHDLIPDKPDYGYNLIVIDPPWENGSVYQKAAYPTLPNKNLFYLPVKRFAHTDGALVVLWTTNREKLCLFVKELFSSWGVNNIVSHYWLKVKPDCSLICEMDLFHHRPYERFLLGYIKGKNSSLEHGWIPSRLQNNQVIISVPGAYSRKPPLGKLLADHIPGPKPPRCIELFARELVGGWTSWGNEPLRFQESRFFSKRNNPQTSS